MNSLEKALGRAFPASQIKYNEPMARHTTMKVGGPADAMVFPTTGDEVARAVACAREAGAPCLVIGNGSNLIVRDGGYRGLVVALGEGFAEIRADGERLYAQAGALLSQVGARALAAGLTGFEFAAGIPGTVGGGAAMNAGAYGGELKDVLSEATVLEDGVVARYGVSDFEYGYRKSRVLDHGYTVLDATFQLKKGDPAAIAALMNDLGARRRDKQPLSYPSAGSVFKRPVGHFAGALIEQAGLKGARVGGASVSEKHAGFIINDQNATAKDVLALIRYVQERVMADAGVALECEVRVLGED